MSDVGPRSTQSALLREPATTGVYVVHPTAACIQCDGPRPEMAMLHGDPFCTTRCARAWHGCSLDPATERPERKCAA